MDPLAHLSQKLLLENPRQNPNQPPQQPPPPYTPADDSDEDDYNSDADSTTSSHHEENDPPQPINLTINASHSIRGSNNLLPTSPTPLADATKFSTLLLHAVNQINAAAAAENPATRRSVRVDLTINCGVTVVGDRNVIGHVGLRPRQPPAFALAARPAGTTGVVGDVAPAVVGAKRKVEESDDEREIKRVATGGDDDPASNV